MQHTPHYLTRLSPAAARRSAQALLVEQMSGKPADMADPALSDLRSLPDDARSMEALVRAVDPDERYRSSPTAWYTRAGFTDLLGPALQVVSREYPAPDHRAFCRILPARNYMSQQFLTGIDGTTVDEIREGGEFQDVRESTLDIEHESARLKRYGSILSLTVETVANDDSGVYARAAEALIASCYRKESASVYSTLEAGATLADGDAWFDATNSVTSASATAALTDALELFHGQTYVSGEFVDAQPAVIVVPAGWDIASSLELANLSARGIRVMVSGRVQSGYVFADPARTPALGLAGFSLTPTIDLNNKRSAAYGLQMRVEHAFSVVPLSRRGIVKMSLTS
jgi:hypothetical protein